MSRECCADGLQKIMRSKKHRMQLMFLKNYEWMEDGMRSNAMRRPKQDGGRSLSLYLLCDDRCFWIFCVWPDEDLKMMKEEQRKREEETRMLDCRMLEAKNGWTAFCSETIRISYVEIFILWRF